MRATVRHFAIFSIALFSPILIGPLCAQTGGNSGTITGVVTDTSGAVIPGAKVSILNPVSGYTRTAISDNGGGYQFSNVPFNPYHMTVVMTDFAPDVQDVDVRSGIAVKVKNVLKIGESTTTVTVESSGGDLVENDPTFHTDVDRGLFQRLPLESQSSGLSSLVTLSSPGVAADSNGLFHGLGDHASNSFSVDGQPITDQQSKVFSNQLPINSVQSIEVIGGAPPAEYGDKTSLVIDVTTRSGEGLTKPTGSVSASYGSFGTSTASVDLGYGGPNWGNFFEIDGLDTGRFLDPPEFSVFHSKGNEENVFDRIDRKLTEQDSVRLDLNYTRSWFQNPNSFDNVNVNNVISGGASGAPVFGNLGNTDQKAKIETFNIAPAYTRVLGSNAVFNIGPYVRKDSYNYYPSANPLADLSPIQNQSISQARSLLNAGVHSDVTIDKGIHSIKAGAVYEQTFLREHDNVGIVSAFYNSPCVNANGNAVAGYTDPSQCAAAGLVPNPNSGPAVPVAPFFAPVLLSYDLTRGGTFYNFFGHTDVKELALYIQDQIKLRNWVFNVGMRGDLYNGLTVTRQPEPRVGLAYSIPKSSTILRLSYARTLETPFNENLVLSSQGCGNDVLAPLLACTPGVATILKPGFRNEFHAGFQQAFGRYAVVSGEYIWKYTHNAFDFSIFGNTPIFFPIDWHNSKIPGFALRGDVPVIHGFSAYVVMSSVAARFFPPQVAGAGATVGQTGLPFRIDHDEKFNQTTHIQYQMPGRFGPWLGFNWRYDSGLVAGNAPCYGITDPNSPCLLSSTTLSGQPAIAMVSAFGVPLSADQEFQAGFSCNGQRATPTAALPIVCLASQFSSSLINIPAPNTGNNDRNPQRIKPRSLFDVSLGKDDLFKQENRSWSVRLTGVNIANNYVLYNFLSTFSGTHYVTPRTLTAEVGFHF